MALTAEKIEGEISLIRFENVNKDSFALDKRKNSPYFFQNEL